MSTKKQVNTSEEEMVVPEGLVTLEDYVKEKSPNPGLVASFKAEPANNADKPRSVVDWDKDFDIQSKRVYK
jgi:hypothetical protein